MSTNDQVAQNKRNLERILNFPFVIVAAPAPRPDNTKTSLQQGSMKAKGKQSEMEQLERLLKLGIS